MKNYSLLSMLVLLSISFFPQLLPGQGKDDKIRPVTQTVALSKVMIVSEPGKEAILGNIVIRDGLIQSIGKDVSIPVDAKVLEGDSLYVYAGFIDGLSNAGVPKPKENNRRNRGQRPNDVGNPTFEEAGIQPDRQLIEVLSPEEKSIDDIRKLGFTMSHSVPYGNMLPGKGAIVLLHGEDANEMIYKHDAAVFAQLEDADGVYPGTVIGVMSKFRELYKQAEQYQAYEKSYESGPAGMERLNPSHVHRALYPVLNKQQPIFFAAEDVKSIHRILTLQKDLGFPLVLGGVKQGWYLAEQLKTANIPVFLSMDLPEDKTEKEDASKEKKDSPAEEEMTEKGAKDPEKEKLKQRQAAALKEYYDQAANFEKMNITFGFSTMGAKTAKIQEHLRKMIEHGLSEQSALAALTTHPAKMLGLEAVAGTVEKGKLGNLVITDKPYFQKEANVRYVIVEGEVFEYEVKKKKKGDPNAKVDPSGAWSYSFSAMGTTMSGTITIKDEDGDYTGTITNPTTGQEGEVNDLFIDGNVISFTIPYSQGGQSITVEYNLLIDGDSIEGTVTAGTYGSFDVEGRRSSTPE